MAVPDFQSLMLPALEMAAAGPISAESILPEIAHRFGLSQDDLDERLLNRGSKIINRLNLAQVHLQRAGLVEAIQPGRYQATSEGKRVLDERPKRIDIEFLKRFDKYRGSLSTAGKKAAEKRAGRN